MINKKVKTSYPVSLIEVKQHLRIDANNFEDDSYIENSILKSATKFCENFIDKDIALTSNTLTVYDFNASSIKVKEGNLVSIDYIINNSSTLISDYTYEQSDDSFDIEFNTTIDSDPLKIQFTTGYATDECPEEIKQAIFIACGDLYDVERSSYTLGSIKKSDVIERLLMYYKTIRW